MRAILDNIISPSLLLLSLLSILILLPLIEGFRFYSKHSVELLSSTLQCPYDYDLVAVKEIRISWTEEMLIISSSSFFSWNRIIIQTSILICLLNLTSIFSNYYYYYYSTSMFVVRKIYFISLSNFNTNERYK